MILESASGYRERVERAAAELAAAGAATVALDKRTSNLFRPRPSGTAKRLNLRSFDHVLAIDPTREVAVVEGMIPYQALVRATLREGWLPAVVPQLATITVGGAISGLGIESSSIRHGLVHETVEEMDILLADGSVATCSRSQQPDLFYGIPNSYGTLGYVLRAAIRLVPAPQAMRLEHRRYYRGEDLFSAMAAATEPYVDGVVFGDEEMYMTLAMPAAAPPHALGNYKWLRPYYQSIRERTSDYLTASDYIWRWDTDWFWCSKQFALDRTWMRLCATPWLMNSRTYGRVMRFANRVLPDRGTTESVIQDVDIPIGNAPEYLRFLLSEIGILPIWICPFTVRERWPLYPLEPGLHINFGFWDVIPARGGPGYHNRKVEDKAVALGGRKGLYSSVWWDRETFWSLFNGTHYRELKRKYDPQGRFADLYTKCTAGRRR